MIDIKNAKIIDLPPKGGGLLTKDKKEDTKFIVGEIDYAILDCVSYDINTIQDITNMLQIKTITIEKHMYVLVKEGFINFQNNRFTIAPKAGDAVSIFDRDHHEKCVQIDKFVISSINRKKEQTLKTYKTIDIISIVLMVVIVILIIYFGKDLLSG